MYIDIDRGYCVLPVKASMYGAYREDDILVFFFISYKKIHRPIVNDSFIG